MKHPYAEILHAIADGKRMQRKNLSEVWVGQSADETLWEIYDGIYSLDSYRIHPDDVEPVAEDSSVAGALAEAEDAFRRYSDYFAMTGNETKARGAWAALLDAGDRAHVFIVRWLLAPVVIMTVSVATIAVYVASLGERCIVIGRCD